MTMSATERMQKLYRRLLELPESEQDAFLGSPGDAPHTPPNPEATSRTPGFIAMLDPSTSPPHEESTCTSSSARTIPTTTLTTLPPRPTTFPTGPINPFTMGSIKHGEFSLPNVTPKSLKPYADFYNGDFTSDGVKAKLHNLASQHTFMAFAAVREPENRIKIVHSLARYVAPLGEEAEDRNHNHYFTFKGERTKRCNPPAIHFRMSALTAVKCKVHLMDTAKTHYNTEGNPNIIPLDGSEIEEEVPRPLLIPHKWAAELVDKHYLPSEFLNFVIEKMEDWSDVEQENNKFLTTWALAACGATNRTSQKFVSQLGSPLADFDLITDVFDEWTDARLIQTLGERVATNNGNGGGDGNSDGAFRQIFNVNIPDVPRPTIDQMEMAFHRWADAHKRETERPVLAGSKFSDT